MENENKKKLLGKYFIKGEILVKTGLHVGGSKTALDIGGIDTNVIKTANGVPYIPGSSLKGKLRSMLAREEGSEDVKADSKGIREIFGFPPKQKDAGGKEIDAEQTRLIVRDAFLKNWEEMLNKKGEFKDLELAYTEGKWENSIDRKSGTAGSPRQIERVPPGAIFELELIYDVYDDKDGSEKLKKDSHIKLIKQAMRLLQDDYLGGSGSRGYGQIEFQNIQTGEKTIENYKENSELQLEAMEL